MKVYIDNLSSTEIRNKYNVSRTTAWRAKKRGWLVPDYHCKKINTSFVYDIAAIEKGREYAKNLLFRYPEIPAHIKEDFISDAVLRYMELADSVKENKIAAFIARTARWNANNFLKSKEKLYFEPIIQ